MKLHGALSSNLQDAIASAKRLRGHPVYPDTISYWTELLHEARRFRADLDDEKRPALDVLVAQLEAAVAEHKHMAKPR